MYRHIRHGPGNRARRHDRRHLYVRLILWYRRILNSTPSRYVPVHIEYVLTEILKNAFRATVEAHQKSQSSHSTKALAPVRITISHATLPAATIDSGSSRRRTPSSYVSIRVRDQGGGVNPKDLPRIFSYAFTTAKKEDDADNGGGGGPYAAQAVGGMAAIASGGGSDGGNLFGEIVGKGLQTGLGTIAGLGYGCVFIERITLFLPD